MTTLRTRTDGQRDCTPHQPNPTRIARRGTRLARCVTTLENHQYPLMQTRSTDPGQSDALDSYKTSIARLSTARASVGSAATQLYQVLDDGYASLPAANELQHDASVVQAKLREATRGLDVEQLADAAYAEDLKRIATRIENAQGGHGAEEIARILREVQENDGSGKTGAVQSADGGKVDVDVKHELDCAGRADRLALLQVQERGLDLVRLVYAPSSSTFDAEVMVPDNRPYAH